VLVWVVAGGGERPPPHAREAGSKFAEFEAEILGVIEQQEAGAGDEHHLLGLKGDLDHLRELIRAGPTLEARLRRPLAPGMPLRRETQGWAG